MITVRLPIELEEKLNQCAKNEERSKSYIIRKALEDYIDCYEESHSNQRVNRNDAITCVKDEQTPYQSVIQDLDTILFSIQKMKPLLQEKYHVKTIGVFGSYVRNEQTADSDLDILIELSSPIGLFAFMKMETELSEVLKVPVDLVMKSALKPTIGQNILQEVIMV